MSIGERMKECRRNVHMSQEALGEVMDVHANTIRKWEKSLRSPRAEELSRLATALNTTVAYLSGETDDPSPAHDVREEPEPSTVEKRNNGYLIYKDGERLVELPPTPEGYALIEKFMMQKHAASGDGI